LIQILKSFNVISKILKAKTHLCAQGHTNEKTWDNTLTDCFSSFPKFSTGQNNSWWPRAHTMSILSLCQPFCFLFLPILNLLYQKSLPCRFLQHECLPARVFNWCQIFIPKYYCIAREISYHNTELFAPSVFTVTWEYWYKGLCLVYSSWNLVFLPLFYHHLLCLIFTCSS
jgi:hypothetical protein